MSCYTREQIEATMASKGYKYFTGGDYDVNKFLPFCLILVASEESNLIVYVFKTP